MDLHLAEGEYRFCSIVWERGAIASGDLAQEGARRLGWKKSTCYTVLRRLCQRGILTNENAQVRALVGQEQVQRQQSVEMVERTFGGSLPRFLTAFMQGRRISDQEAEQLKALIDNYRRGGKPDE